MKNSVMARRYARALYEAARATHTLDDVVQAASNLKEALVTVPVLRQVLANPMAKPELKQKAVAAVTSNKLVLKLTLLMARRKRLGLLAETCEALSEMADESNGIVRALVKTAIPLSEEQKREVEKKLASSWNKQVMGRFEHAADLIGGMWVKVGDSVLDASLRGRIDDLRHALVHSSN